MNKKRILISTLLGSLLGIFCIIGMTTRLNLEFTNPLIIGTWFNRVVLGITLGLLPNCKSLSKAAIKGILAGTIIGFEAYLYTGDLTGYIASLVYGLITSIVLYFTFKTK